MAKLKHVIIGNGPAGITAAETIRTTNPNDQVVVLTEEPHLSYSRILLPDYIAGRVSLGGLWLRSDSYYQEAGIEVRLRAKVVSVQPEEQVIVSSDGERISFDRLLIACGGRPKLPLIDGIERVPVLTLKTIDDAHHIIGAVRRGAHVLVLARDLVGVEITRAFSQLGMQVTYVEWGDSLLPHILDPATAEELIEKMKNAGVKVIVDETIHAIEPAGETILMHSDSQTLRGDFLSIAIGKSPQLDWLRPSGIMVDAGIIADERLRTNFPNVYAAGDAAEIFEPKTQRRKLLFGWKNAVEQGRLAGANMCGDTKMFEVAYVPGLKQIFGVDVRHRWK